VDYLSVKEAGALGGAATLRRWGRGHFVEAGRRGQLVMARRYTSEDRRRWGKLGGRPRRNRLLFIMGEEGKPTEGGLGSPPCSTPSPPHLTRSNRGSVTVPGEVE